MGLPKIHLDFLISTPLKLSGSTVLSLGNPFFNRNTLRDNRLSLETIEDVLSRDRNEQAPFLMKNVLGAEQLDILDISKDEGANHIYDLNQKIEEESLKDRYDLIIDPGTQEHIFNNNVFLENLFYLLGEGGVYLFSVPANGALEHGFRQYSPTFFYDLCYANKKYISLMHLSLYNKNIKEGINVLPLYERLDKEYAQIVDLDSESYKLSTLDLGSFTGSALKLLNDMSVCTMLIGAIRKNKSFEVNHSSPQCLYRNMTLSEVIPSSERVKKTFRRKFAIDKAILKELFFRLPIPSSLKLGLIKLFSSIYHLP